MLPERAFQKKLGGYAPATLEGGGSAPAAPSQPTNQTITTSNIAPWAQPGVSSLIQSAMQNVYPNQTTNPDGSVTLGNQAGYTPFNYNTALNQPTSAQGQALSAAESTVAGFSPLQQQAQQSAYNLQVPGQYNQASNMAGAAGIGALGTTGQAGMYGQYGAGLGQQGANIGSSLAQQSQDPNAMQNYMNPYLQNSLAPALALQNQQFGQLGAQQQAAATQSGAFGGGREAVMAGLNQQNQMLAQNQLVGNAYNQAYNTAQGQMNTANQAALAGNAQAMQGAGIGLQGVGAQQAGYGQAGAAGTNLAGIGGQQLAAQQGVIGTQATQGALQQQQNQNTLNQAMTNYNTAQTMPMTQLGQLESLYTGAPQNITTTGYTAAPSTVSQVAGLGGAAIAGANLAGKKAGGIVKMASGGIATGVPAGKLPSMLANLSDQQLAAKTNLKTNDPETASDALSQQAFRANARAGVASAAGGGFVDMASGGIVAFGKGGEADLNTPEASMGDESNQPDVKTPTLQSRMADAQALLPNKEGTNAAYFEALKSSQTDPKQQFWQRMLQGSLGVAAGTSPNAITNFAKGVEPAVSGYAEDVKSQQAAKQQMAKANFDIANMDYTDKANLLKQVTDSQEKGDKIAADLGMSRDRLAQELTIAIAHDKQTGINAQTAANASMASAGASQKQIQNQIGVEAAFLKEQHSDWSEAQINATAQKNVLSQMHPINTLSGDSSIQNAITNRLKEDTQIKDLRRQLLSADEKDQPKIQQQIDIRAGQITNEVMGRQGAPSSEKNYVEIPGKGRFELLPNGNYIPAPK
jgi:hypothetical protein